MEHLKLLVVTNGLSSAELKTLGGGLEFIADKVCEDVKHHLLYEDVVAFQCSHALRDREKEFGYVLIVGREAYEKTQKQVADTSMNVQKLPGLAAWGGSNKKLVASTIAELFKQWSAFAVEKKLLVTPVSQESAEEATQDRAEWIESNLTDFERYLEMQLKASRFQAIIFRLQEDANPFMEVVDATRKLRVPIQDVTPILVAPEVLKDEEVSKKIATRVKQNGFKDPYLLPIRDFIVLVRICCQLSKSGRARLEIALEPADETGTT